MVDSQSDKLSFLARIIDRFLGGVAPIFLILLALAGGTVGLLLTPREEEPQIVVPLADVIVSAPGLTELQVERQVATPLEKLLFQIDGVEYVYSMSSPGQAIVTVRFYVGEDREDSLVKIYNKIHSNLDLVPASVRAWVVKPIEIDDVPIVIATLWSRDPTRVNDHDLRRLAEEVELKLQAVQNTNSVSIVGGRPRLLRVELDPEAMAARKTTSADLEYALLASNLRYEVGEFERLNSVVTVRAGDSVASADELSRLVVNVVDGLPVYLDDVATVKDGPADISTYSWIGFGPASVESATGTYPAVSLAIPKKKGTNAVWVADAVERQLKELQESFFPPEIEYEITRNYGATANEKVNELVLSLGIAVLTVVLFIGMVLGWRAALVIALAIPVCYGATLLINLLAGYTINRVTLFALILALGLLVDDPITAVENIERYSGLKKFSARKGVLLALQEVLPALIMSTVAIIISFVPLFFITGMMGPYMAPMALNVPLTVTVSTIVAICVTPFLAYHIVSRKSNSTTSAEPASDTRSLGMAYRVYSLILGPILRSRKGSLGFLGLVGLLFVGAVILPAFRTVPLKMLPFDNKNEFQLLVDMPEGTTLETTEGVVRDLAKRISTVPEVHDFVAYVGVPSPMDFNGMVRHYYLRQKPNQADLRINLAHKSNREHQSHEIALRLRSELTAIADSHGASLAIVEVPPGPPVISTLTVEVYGEETTSYQSIQNSAELVADRFRREPLVVDVDTTVEADAEELIFVTDKEKAALSGVSTQDIAKTLQIALGGSEGHYLETPFEAHPLEIELRLPRAVRSSTEALGTLYVRGQPGIAKVREGLNLQDAPVPLVPLAELGQWKTQTVGQTIYHKNLERVAYVFAELAGRPPAEAIVDMAFDRDRDTTGKKPLPLEGRTYFYWGGNDPWSVEPGTRLVWNGEGEWKITLDVFRDLGIAFAAALLGMFVVLFIQTSSAVLSLIILTAIPLSALGIMPGFWLLNSMGELTVGEFPNPTFFTATAMIGMIALAGIVVRNSVVLIDFVHQSLREGMDLDEALLQSGAIRLRPIILTAGTTFLGNVVITLDPIFSGLAWAIIFGLCASTVFTLGVVPVVYGLVYRNQPGQGLPQPPAEEEE